MSGPKENKMQAQSVPIPINTKKNIRLVQAEIDLALFLAVEKEIKDRGLNIKSVVEWGWKEFLIKTNPAAAKKIGIAD